MHTCLSTQEAHSAPCYPAQLFPPPPLHLLLRSPPTIRHSAPVACARGLSAVAAHGPGEGAAVGGKKTFLVLPLFGVRGLPECLLTVHRSSAETPILRPQSEHVEDMVTR